MFATEARYNLCVQLIEGQSLAWGLIYVALHVLSGNVTAQTLYRSLGYGVISFNLVKPITLC